MKRRTLDILFSLGGLALAGLLLVLGLVMTSNANFADDYVTDQLSQQKITFKSAATLTDVEKARHECLTEYGTTNGDATKGQPLTTGKQAECYANEFIALHLEESATAAGYEGYTYATLGGPQSELRAKVAEGEKQSPPPADLDKTKAELTKVNGLRDTMFRGETLRGLLLTSFGFSVFGTKGSDVATVAYIVAALLAILSIAGLIHAFVTPKNKAFAPTEPVEPQMREKDEVKA